MLCDSTQTGAWEGWDKGNISFGGASAKGGYETRRRITKDKYEKKRKEYRAKQKEISGKTAKLHFADEEYYLTSEYLLKLASYAGKLFESSEAHEKRLLLKMTLQNLELKGRKAQYDWINPFDKIAFYASRQAWLPSLGDIITTKVDELLDIQSILNILQDFNYMGMLKERWEEMKKAMVTWARVSHYYY